MLSFAHFALVLALSKEAKKRHPILAGRWVWLRIILACEKRALWCTPAVNKSAQICQTPPNDTCVCHPVTSRQIRLSRGIRKSELDKWKCSTVPVACANRMQNKRGKKRPRTMTMRAWREKRSKSKLLYVSRLLPQLANVFFFWGLNNLEFGIIM